MVVLPSWEAIAVYEAAIESYARYRNRAGLYRSLLAIGMPADQIRWHAAQPGQRLVAIGEGGPEW